MALLLQSFQKKYVCGVTRPDNPKLNAVAVIGNHSLPCRRRGIPRL